MNGSPTQIVNDFIIRMREEDVRTITTGTYSLNGRSFRFELRSQRDRHGLTLFEVEDSQEREVFRSIDNLDYDDMAYLWWLFHAKI